MAANTPRIDKVEAASLSAKVLSDAQNITALVDVDMIPVPYTSITNRAKIPNLASDAGVRFGLDRIMIQRITEVQDEFGPNGERIFKSEGDDLGLIRFGKNPVMHFDGSYSNINQGPGLYLAGVGSFVEITFYGTGLNILGYSSPFVREASITVNGVAYGTYVENTTSHSFAIIQRKYGMNAVRNVVSGLALGVHTVKVTVSTDLITVFGFEIIGPTSTLSVNPGSVVGNEKSLTLSSQQLPAYNSGFESGTLGSRGGRVIVYLKSDGTIGKAVTPTNAAAAYISSADHTNEDVVRTYNWRDFGSDRPDDFSTVYGTTTNRSFTLDDGTTTLAGGSIQGTASTGAFTTTQGLAFATSGTSFVSFTFVGTGVDVFGVSGVAYTGVITVSIDGTSVGTITSIASGKQFIKLASGLPYGTHTVRLFLTSVTTGDWRIMHFVTYSPKKPTLPSGAIELADYCLMANYVANATAGVETIGTGVLRKGPDRELVYVNGTGGTNDWSVGQFVGAVPTGWQAGTNRLNAYFEYTFFGTGAEIRFNTQAGRSANITVSLQNLSSGGSLLTATTANFPTLTSSVYGTGAAFASGILDQLDAVGQLGSGVTLSGLPLGVWKIRLTNGTASAVMVVDAIDVITPVHSPKSMYAGGFDGSINVGSCAISDERTLSASRQQARKAWVQSPPKDVAVSSFSVSSTSYVPVPEASVTIRTNGGPIEVTYYSRIQIAGSIALDHQIFVDGVDTGINSSIFETTDSAGNTMNLSLTHLVTGIIPVSAGVHRVEIYWKISSGTATAQYAGRLFNVKEL